MAQGNYTLRLAMVEGTRTRLDYISFDHSEPCAGVGDVGTTWGRIKTLWK
jgi:hypothetical protein